MRRAKDWGTGIMATITELNCPYCGKPLTGDEYNHALEEFTTRAQEEYKEQLEKGKRI
ncbi:MAG: hypothetical protein WAM14_09520 [Candidatus Nitrosopolaris sp.]